MLACDNKLFNLPIVKKMNFHEFLTFVQYQKEMSEVEQEKINKIKAKNKQ